MLTLSEAEVVMAQVPSLERQLEEILFANLDPLTKVRQIIHLGFDEEVASAMVERYQVGQPTVPIYYESLDFKDNYFDPTD